MAYPQGFLFQPSVSLALHSCPTFSPSMLLGPRTEELGRSSSGSAFAPYAGSAFNSSSPGFNSHLQYSGEPRTAASLNSFVVSRYKLCVVSESYGKSVMLNNAVKGQHAVKSVKPKCERCVKVKKKRQPC